jgi:hypothetical protein
LHLGPEEMVLGNAMSDADLIPIIEPVQVENLERLGLWAEEVGRAVIGFSAFGTADLQSARNAGVRGLKIRGPARLNWHGSCPLMAV